MTRTSQFDLTTIRESAFPVADDEFSREIQQLDRILSESVLQDLVTRLDREQVSRAYTSPNELRHQVRVDLAQTLRWIESHDVGLIVLNEPPTSYSAGLLSRIAKESNMQVVFRMS